MHEDFDCYNQCISATYPPLERYDDQEELGKELEGDEDVEGSKHPCI